MRPPPPPVNRVPLRHRGKRACLIRIISAILIHEVGRVLGSSRPDDRCVGRRVRDREVVVHTAEEEFGRAYPMSEVQVKQFLILTRRPGQAA